MKALVFDTIASNSEWKSGAVKLLEEEIGPKVFYHVCRHHIYELILRGIWRVLFGETTMGPENIFFNDFKSKWDNIDKSKSFRTLQLGTDQWLVDIMMIAMTLNKCLKRKRS